MVLLAQTDMVVYVIHGVILTRLLRFILELFLANTCLHAFVRALQIYAQTAGFM